MEVVVFDQGGQIADTMEKLGAKYGINIEQYKGHGESLGGKTRQEGFDAFNQTIRDFETSSPDRSYRTGAGESIPDIISARNAEADQTVAVGTPSPKPTKEP